MTQRDERPIPRLLPYYLAQALGMAALGSVIALLGDIRDTFELSETRLGLIVGAGFLTAFVTQLTLGKLADRGYAPAMVRFGLIATAASMVAFAFSDSFWEFLLARAVLGVAVGIAQPAVRRTVILADQENTGRNIGRLGMTEVIGFALGPAIAGLLAEAGSLDLPFFVLAATIIVVVLTMGMPEADDKAQSGDDSMSSLELLRDPRLLGTLVIVASEFILIGGYEAVWAVMLTDLGAKTWQIGVSFTIFAIPLGALAPLGGAWAQRSGGLRLTIIALGSSAVVAFLFGVIDTLSGLVVVALVAAIGSGLGFPAGLYLFSQTAADERQAAAQGLMGATEVLFGGLSAVLAAWLYDAHGRATVWVVVPILMLGLLLIGVAVRGRTPVPAPVVSRDG